MLRRSHGAEGLRRRLASQAGRRQPAKRMKGIWRSNLCVSRRERGDSEASPAQAAPRRPSDIRALLKERIIPVGILDVLADRPSSCATEAIFNCPIPPATNSCNAWALLLAVSQSTWDAASTSGLMAPRSATNCMSDCSTSHGIFLLGTAHF